MSELQVLSLNVRGLRETTKRIKVFNYLNKFKADVIFIQEAHVVASDYDLWKSNWGRGGIVYNPFTERSAGQMILLRNKEDIISHDIIVEGRCQILKIKKLGSVITLVNVYAPNKDEEQIIFYRNIQQHLINKPIEDYLIIGGDFNLVLDNQKDKLGGINQKRKSLTILKEIIEDINLADVWREKNPDKKKYTWSQKSPKIRCRLDYFLIQQKHLDRVTSCKICPSIASDHDIVAAKVKISSFIRGPG